MTDEQREAFLRLIDLCDEGAEQRYLDALGKEAAAHLKKLFEELVMAPARDRQEKKSTMTPCEQIQEHACMAAAKIREAMNEFAEATGCKARVSVNWHHGNIKNIVASVGVHVTEGFES